MTTRAARMRLQGGPIIFFDGACVLCNGFADWVLRRDRHRVMRVATLQGETAAALLPHHGVEDFSSVVLWEAGQIYLRSEAVIRMLSALGGLWRLAPLLRVIPRFARDAVYAFVAGRRFKWFGRRSACRLPTPEEATRFLP